MVLYIKISRYEQKQISLGNNNYNIMTMDRVNIVLINIMPYAYDASYVSVLRHDSCLDVSQVGLGAELNSLRLTSEILN